MDSCVPDEGKMQVDNFCSHRYQRHPFALPFVLADMFHAESLQSGETSNMVTAAEAASNLEEVKEYDDIADSAFVFNRGNGNQKKGLSQHAVNLADCFQTFQTARHALLMFSVRQAATQIQALYRGYALRAMLIRHEAAIMIQAVFRGHLVRQILSEVEY